MKTNALNSIPRPRSVLSHLPLLAILLIAAILRFQNVNAIEHNVDHAYPIWQALTTLDRGAFPIIGQNSSILIPNGALTGYLFLPWVALTRSPFGAYLFAITLNALAVLLAYHATALLLDKPRGLIAALLMAINPWNVEYSRTTWVQALIPFLACLVFWLLIPVLLKTAARPGRRIVLALVALTAMTQTYLLAFAALIPVGILLVAFRRRVPGRAFAVGAGIFIIVNAIYGAALVANHAWTTERLDETSVPARLSTEAWSHAVRLVSGQNYPVSRGLDAPENDWVLRENASQVAHYAILAALLIGIVAALRAIWRRDRWANGLIALIWFFAPILLLTYVSRPVHPFYLLLTLPAGSVLAAWGAGYLLRWRAGRMALVGVAAAMTVLFGLNVWRFAEDTLAYPGVNGPGVLPLGVGVEAARALLPADARLPGAVVFADVDESFMNSLAGSVFPVDRDLNVNQITYVPVGGATYLIFGKPGDTIRAPVGGSDSLTYTFGDGTFFRRYRVLPDTVASVKGDPIKGDKGITYLGMVLEQPLMPGSTSTLRTYWRVDDLQPDRAGWLFGPFAHIYDATGKRVAIGTGAVVPGLRWRLGDIHVHRIALMIPADAVPPFTLQIGQYDGVHNANVTFALPDGTTYAAIPAKP